MVWDNNSQIQEILTSFALAEKFYEVKCLQKWVIPKKLIILRRDKIGIFFQVAYFLVTICGAIKTPYGSNM